MTQAEYLLLLVGMGLVPYIPRWLPISFLSRRQLPQWFSQWLDLVPVAILSALVLPELVTSGDSRHLDLLRPQLLAALPTLLFAMKTKSLGGTVLLGMLIFWMLERLI